MVKNFTFQIAIKHHHSPKGSQEIYQRELQTIFVP